MMNCLKYSGQNTLWSASHHWWETPLHPRVHWSHWHHHRHCTCSATCSIVCHRFRHCTQAHTFLSVLGGVDFTFCSVYVIFPSTRTGGTAECPQFGTCPALYYVWQSVDVSMCHGWLINQSTHFQKDTLRYKVNRLMINGREERER